MPLSLSKVRDVGDQEGLSQVPYGRPRAGTLPSNSFLGRLAPSSSTPPPTSSPLSNSQPILNNSNAPDFPFVAGHQPLSRIRSGSLTVPNSGLPNVFNAFAGSTSGTNWTPRPAGSSDLTVETAVASVGGPDSSNFGDDSVRTLDYLGLQLDEPDFGTGSAGSIVSNDTFPILISDKTRAQGRLRSHTIAAFSKTESFARARGSTYSSSTTSNSTPSRHSAEDEVGQSLSASIYRHSSSGSTDSTRQLYSTTPFTSATPLASDLGAAASVFRPRAATIGILDEQREIYLRRRAGTMATQPSSNLSTTYIDASSVTGSYVESDQAIEEQPNWTSFDPDGPTRSLWIGNLDPHTTLAELNAVFAPYGPIESTRLLSDKECGFVNFLHIADAIRAKEDVLDRLGGQLTPSSSLVRIGYGKEVNNSPSPPPLGRVDLSPSMDTLSLLDSNLQSAPTRALWIGSIPVTVTTAQILAIFSPFGPVESARILGHKSCAFINFENMEDAIAARKDLNGYEIFGAEIGPVRIGFAKVPSRLPVNFDSTTGIDPALESYHSNLAVGLIAGNVVDPFGISNGGMAIELDQIHTVLASTTEAQLLMKELSVDDADSSAHVAAVAESNYRGTYYTTISQHLASDPVLGRRYGHAEALRLRDLRKRLEEPISPEEVDTMISDLIEEVVALSSDYIGNTIVQKLFERASVSGRMVALERLAPHLATIGTHKNGTWSVQKLIQCATTAEEFYMIAQNLRPFTPPLLLNDFGNYVVQGALRFGSPATTFIFDAMVDRIWEIGSGRFGARSARQILETPGVDILQIKRVAIAIVLNSIPLATSANGALLLTWLLDASGLPNRYRVLATRFSPHLVHLATHKLAAVAVLKIISQTIDPIASNLLTDNLFDSQQTVLEDILSDPTAGISFISKLVSSRPDPRDRVRMSERVKAAMAVLQVQGLPAYRRLLDDLVQPYQSPPGPSIAQAASNYRSRRAFNPPPPPNNNNNSWPNQSNFSQNGPPPPNSFDYNQYQQPGGFNNQYSYPYPPNNFNYPPQNSRMNNNYNSYSPILYNQFPIDQNNGFPPLR